METNIYKLLLLVLAMVISVEGFSQDNRTLDTKVADVLAQMPIKNLSQLDKVMEEIIQMGPEGLQKIASLLTPDGVGDDTKVRFALNSLAGYSSLAGRDEARTFSEEGFLQALKSENNTEIKTFLLSQLNLVGGDRTIPEISGYLKDENLCEPATQTLLAIHNEHAAREILSSLPIVAGKCKSTLVHALGELRVKEAIVFISPMVDSDETRLRRTALEALANIGSPESYKILLKAAKAVQFKSEPTNAAAAFLNYTTRLSEQGEMVLCKKACKAIFNLNRSDELLHNYSKALSIYVANFGYEATPLLIKAMDSPDKAFRFSALNLAEDLGGMADTQKWIKEAKSSSDETKAEIIMMLGRRGDILAISFLTENLESQSSNVREQSIIALSKLQKKEAIPILLAHLAKGEDIETGKTVLSQLLDRESLVLVAEEMRKSQEKAKAAFIELMGAMAGTMYFNEIMASTSSTDPEVRSAAFAALKNVSADTDLDELIALLLSVQDKNEISQVQMAIVEVAKDIKEEQKKEGKLLSILEKTDRKERIISLLPEIGGPVALGVLKNYFDTSTGLLKAASFKALTRWKDFSITNTLFEISKNNDGDYRDKATASFISLVGSSEFTRRPKAPSISQNHALFILLKK